MALDARNIIVGASPLFLSKKDSTDVSYAAVLPEGSNVTPGASVLSSSTAGALSNSAMNAAYRNVGYTNNGLQITYNPTYGSVTVDQLLDTAKLFKESMEVMLATEFAEATLENVLAVFGQGGETLNSGELGLAAGALGLQPTERQLIAVGNAPTVNSAGANQKSERVYYARRVLSVQQSQFTLARNAATVFPVTFRLLPDAAYAGKEYGVIVDRVLSA
jgi:hypothetical protein